ncbi:MAG: hypothetical protein ACK56I_36860, partial [bacterium]
DHPGRPGAPGARGLAAARARPRPGASRAADARRARLCRHRHARGPGRTATLHRGAVAGGALRMTAGMTAISAAIVLWRMLVRFRFPPCGGRTRPLLP